ncbi:response regulator receiver protein [Desulfarculus baarsii DSM 2075]|uniref:Response regulator receiver protein n=1 Tax=Desulfarculus baarsii (strain ATCC 33931 / DSM 2075 / LMG 7858 / VKM B-1802 / 2st14) TaxID=644282 RepID=E1QIX6_DESB2|nr:response regulator [Desulfarculus baarsii]ADK85519.1 response regulator receiver protein [Desulfarculus baarsii DSM 2075]
MAEPRYVLIVDDDPDLVEAVAMNLEARGFAVGKAYDGVEAWDSIKSKRPDLVVLDVMMPRKNGYEVCEELKNDNDYKDIPVILLTAVGSAVPSTAYTHQDGMKVLADDYVPKPVDLDKLAQMVAELI